MNWSRSPHTGKIEGLFSTPDPEQFVTTLRDEIAFELDGIEGDRHAGFERLSGGREKKQYPKGTRIRNNRQWSAVSIEEMKRVANTMQLDEVKPEWIGANLLISGIEDLSLLPSMSLIKLFHENEEGPVLVIFGQNKPCMHPHHVMEEALAQSIAVPFTKAAVQYRGLVGWVEKPGTARLGDRVEIWVPWGNF
jgi:hypothetical protein